MKKMNNKRVTFSKIYVGYLALLTVLVIAAIAYVKVTIRQYETMRPEMRIEEAIELLSKEVAEGDFFAKYNLQNVTPGIFEEHMDVKSKYLELYTDGNTEYALKGGQQAEDELLYNIKNGDTVLAEVKLKAMGPAVTKLAVFIVRDWQIEEIKPVINQYDYTLSVPDDFVVKANDIMLTSADGVKEEGKKITYTVSDVYVEPEFAITDKDGNAVSYTVKDQKVIAEFFDYTLTLPNSLMVELNGEKYEGQAVDAGHTYYSVRTLEKPDVLIKDYYGNSVAYEGEAKFPLTNMAIIAEDGYQVFVDGEAVPAAVATEYANKEYEQLVNYVEKLPNIMQYDIAVLKDDAQVSVQDAEGNNVILDNANKEYDFTARSKSLDTVPESVSNEIDVLDIAQKWSMFMTADYPFDQMKQYLVPDSYQYKVARQFATGVDITFTSRHTLGNPPFTDNKVSNFVWITDESFSVDISFVKHMNIVRTGDVVDDVMNDRFYFVKYDDTKDGVSNAQWKLVSMKEIVSDEE